MQFIDLRSDTVTRPTPEMRQAMLVAPVGDDVIDIDPTVVQLQERVAEVLGKEASIFMPSGTMTNQIALRVHCQPGDEFLCESGCHIYNYEQGAFAQLSGLVARTFTGNNALLEVDQLQGCVRPDNEHAVRTKLLCIENTHNRGAGKIYDLKRTNELCAWAHASGVNTHLDGARLFNASVASGASVLELAKPFDSVSVCFSKGLGAPIGSCLAGSKQFIKAARRARKLFGGGMRQVGILAAAAIYALDHHVDRLHEDHANAKLLAKAIAECSFLQLADSEPETNIVIFHIDPAWGTADRFVDQLKSHSVLSLAFGPQSVRLVTHLDVSREQILEACQIIRNIAKI